jgi:hypothetical protein
VDNYAEPPARYQLLFMILDGHNKSELEPRWHWRRTLANLFIAFFLYSTIAQIIPNGPCRRFTLWPVRPVVQALGLWQNFVTFGPEPAKANEYLSAIMTFDDGTSTIWHCRDFEHFDSLQAWMASFPYRTLFTHHLRHDATLFADFAVYLAGQLSVGDKHPASLKLVRRNVYTTFLDPVTGRLIDRGQPHEDVLYQCGFAPRVKR